MFVLLFAAISMLLWGVFVPGETLFSNDGPLGRLISECHHLPERFTGCWNDLNSIGYRELDAPPNLSFGLQSLLKPVVFSKFYAPIALMSIGLAAWYFFRRLGLASAACILGGLAAALNSSFFSAACWGVASQIITFAMTFLAMGLLLDTSSRLRWIRVTLAGMAVGMGVAEGADIGAIFSILVAAFAMYYAWIQTGPAAKKIGTGVARVALVTICAILLAAQAITSLVVTNIEGVAGAKQDATTKAAHWKWATQWSLPKRETLGLIVPGLFGYRMESQNNEGSSYWGTIGRDTDWDKFVENGKQGSPPKGYTRFSGGGFYAGVSVVLLALWAGVESMRRKDSAFNSSQRRLVWFWLGIALISLLLAYGRFAPFYQWLYALPYFSTIRNPVKFVHVLSFALVVLFAYGADSLWRKYMWSDELRSAQRWKGVFSWWSKAERFEKNWFFACLATLCLSVLAWYVYAANRHSLEQYLQSVQFTEVKAPSIALFSIQQVQWFLIFFVLSAGLMVLIFSGAFVRGRAKWGGILLGLLMVIDLGRANQPWVVYWDYKEKYSSNAIIDQFRDKPYKHRVTLLPFIPPGQFLLLNQVYQVEWIQHQLPYYNIQALDVVQMSRKPEDLAAFEGALIPNTADSLPLFTRFWQLTNTRYIIGAAGFETVLNEQADPIMHRFRILSRFKIVPKPGITHPSKAEDMTATPATDGPFALFEFTGALPRAKLYSNWQVNPDNQDILQQLTSKTFDPEQSVLVSENLPAPSNVAHTNQIQGTVEFVSYAPKHIVLKSASSSRSILLLNDRFDPGWKVSVDGQSKTLLRCNYLMRGVYLEPGEHTVEFRFQPTTRPLYISLATIAVGLLLLGVVVATELQGKARGENRPGGHSEHKNQNALNPVVHISQRAGK